MPHFDYWDAYTRFECTAHQQCPHTALGPPCRLITPYSANSLFVVSHAGELACHFIFHVSKFLCASIAWYLTFDNMRWFYAWFINLFRECSWHFWYYCGFREVLRCDSWYAGRYHHSTYYGFEYRYWPQLKCHFTIIRAFHYFSNSSHFLRRHEFCFMTNITFSTTTRQDCYCIAAHAITAWWSAILSFRAAFSQ